MRLVHFSENLCEDQDAASPTNGTRTSVFNNRFEAGGFQTFFSGLHGFLIGVRADLHAIVFVSLWRLYEGGKFLFAEIVSDRNSIGFRTQSNNLQQIRAA